MLNRSAPIGSSIILYVMSASSRMRARTTGAGDLREQSVYVCPECRNRYSINIIDRGRNFLECRCCGLEEEAELWDINHKKKRYMQMCGKKNGKDA